MSNLIESIKEENAKKHVNMADSTTIGACILFKELGINMIWTDGKDVVLENEKDLPAATE